VTLGVGGAVVMLILAQPAFNQTSENWLKNSSMRSESSCLMPRRPTSVP
jgi:hypothetical protein